MLNVVLKKDFGVLSPTGHGPGGASERDILNNKMNKRDNNKCYCFFGCNIYLYPVLYVGLEDI